MKYNDATTGRTVLVVDDSPAVIDALWGPFEDAATGLRRRSSS
ncbi:MAG TPA: hypothetical protein VM753_20530 [Anaeromyxobacter sp.]|nr:hypothetical protein [Anaeromyxobacter sp.]